MVGLVLENQEVLITLPILPDSVDSSIGRIVGQKKQEMVKIVAEVQVVAKNPKSPPN